MIIDRLRLFPFFGKLFRFEFIKSSQKKNTENEKHKYKSQEPRSTQNFHRQQKFTNSNRFKLSGTKIEMKFLIVTNLMFLNA